MLVTAAIGEIRDQIKSLKLAGKRVAIVPTMGALHSGHESLIRLASENADAVVVSIFVNPTQFGPNEDLSRYPRPIENDLQICKKLGISVVFTPDNSVMYPHGNGFLSIQINKMADYLCGASRPGHFNGVLQIVNKLLNIVQPDVAVFGQKDIQQFRLIETMVGEFNLPVDLIMGETMREPDGLALSSRNIYLKREERAISPELYRAIRQISKAIGRTEHRAMIASKNKGGMDITSILDTAQTALQEKGLKIDYLTVVDYRTMEPVFVVYQSTTLVIAGAVYLGTTRLIDNIVITV